MPRQRATKLEIRQQLLQIQELLDRHPDGLTAPEIRDGLEDYFSLRLDPRLLRLRLAKLLAIGDIAARGATRGRRYRTTGAYEAWDRPADALFSGLPRPGGGAAPPPRPRGRAPFGQTKRPRSPGRSSGRPPAHPPSPPRLHQDLFAFETPSDGLESEEERARHVSALRWRGHVGYFIEYDPRDSAYPDSLHVGPTGRIPTFSSMVEALLHADQMGFEIEDAEHVFGDYDLDHIDAWCANPRPQDIEYELFVHVLGLIAQLPDIEYDEDLASAHDSSDPAFAKLVKSTDSTLLPGEPFPYIAEWTPEDIANMRRTFELGARAFVNRLVAWPPRL